MKPDRKTVQTTIKMTPAFQRELSEAAAALGISVMEYIRRACAEKMAREAGGEEEQMRELVREVLREEGLIGRAKP